MSNVNVFNDSAKKYNEVISNEKLSATFGAYVIKFAG